jgi:hypothetical protein
LVDQGNRFPWARKPAAPPDESMQSAAWGPALFGMTGAAGSEVSVDVDGCGGAETGAAEFDATVTREVETSVTR